MTSSTQGHAESRSQLARGLIFVGAATMVGNGAAYLLSIVAARLLTPAEFGAFGALLGILITVSTLTIGLQALTARRVATAGADRSEIEGKAIRLAVIVGIGIIVVGAVASWPLAQVFAIPTPALVLGFASLAFVIIGCAAMGIAQGREEHLRLSIGFIANGVGRAAVGIVFALVFASVTGIAAGILIGTAVGALISYLLICPKRWSGSLAPGWQVEFAHISHALIVLFTLTNVDVLLARIFLTEDQSGEYAVGVLLAKIAFFLPNAIIIVLFPKMTASDSMRTVLIATGLTALLGAAITAVSFGLG
ncbi:MAG: oligosaccharide flippase family protein, partial [Actinomycetales bacterium]